MRGTVVEVDDDDVVLEIADGVARALREGRDRSREGATETNPRTRAGRRPRPTPQDSTEHSALTDSSDPSEPTT